MIENARHLGTEFVRRYHRLEVGGALSNPSEPVLFVANHGFGSLFDLNVFTTLAALDELELDRPVTVLVHQLAWTVGVGPLLERIGCRPASAAAATAAFAAGHHVLVFPGGDLDAAKAHRDRNNIVFGGRSGFARLAQECCVPVVPIVTAGTGDTLLVLSDGQGLARRLRLDRYLRLKTMPISLTVPWGLNVGLACFLPYLPAPVQLRTKVLPSMSSGPDDSASSYARRVELAMQRELDDLAGPGAPKR